MTLNTQSATTPESYQPYNAHIVHLQEKWSSSTGVAIAACQTEATDSPLPRKRVETYHAQTIIWTSQKFRMEKQSSKLITNKFLRPITAVISTTKWIFHESACMTDRR